MKRRQDIDFDDCSCGVGQLYCVNDADENTFYDSEPVFCTECGRVGYMVADETAHVVLEEEEI